MNDFPEDIDYCDMGIHAIAKGVCVACKKRLECAECEYPLMREEDGFDKEVCDPPGDLCGDCSDGIVPRGMTKLCNIFRVNRVPVGVHACEICE